MTLQTLTTISTTFIVASGLSLLLGWFFIRIRRDQRRHRNTMLAATAFAALFLIAYVTRWVTFGSKSFEGTGWWRTLYFVNLIPHILFAIAVGPLAVYLIYLALIQKKYRRHRRWARFALPIWLYVAASGWLTYFLLYKVRF
jgi:putative membrane protein